MIINCLYCHTKSLLYFQSKDCNRNVTQETFDHYRRPYCSLFFIELIPSNLRDYYPETYHSIPDTLECLESASKNERFKIEIVQRFISKGRLLEIGPSYGSFTYLAKKPGLRLMLLK